MYHNKQELVEKREIADKKKDEVAKLEKRKEVSDEDIKAKKKELASYNKELANDEQKVKELVRLIIENDRIPIDCLFRKHKLINIAQPISKPRKTLHIIRRNSILQSKF